MLMFSEESWEPIIDLPRFAETCDVKFVEAFYPALASCWLSEVVVEVGFFLNSCFGFEDAYWTLFEFLAMTARYCCC